ncbi:MAG: SufD family Fe-S cluster assembly protein [Clostridia bacterium]|nr:SufD family Fe-S cluster assembly protein [Clostridia bacterium]
MNLNAVDKSLLREIAGLEAIPEGAYNIRQNGKLAGRVTTANIDIVTKEDKPGIDIIIKAGTKGERVDIPVILTESGLKDLVYNDFYVGEDADVTIVAGCGIHNVGTSDAEHDGIHAFHIGKNAKVLYVEKHYGEGDGNGKRILNPTTLIEIDEGGSMTMETAQIKGVDSTVRKTEATLKNRATRIIHEKIMTHGEQYAETDFHVNLDGKDCATHVISRSIAKDKSHQRYISCIDGNNVCSGHTECDAIIMDDGTVTAEPRLNANNIDASLIHEAAIGKIAGEQLIKLMSLGLTEKEAEEQIVNGFLK